MGLQTPLWLTTWVGPVAPPLHGSDFLIVGRRLGIPVIWLSQPNKLAKITDLLVNRVVSLTQLIPQPCAFFSLRQWDIAQLLLQFVHLLDRIKSRIGLSALETFSRYEECGVSAVRRCEV